MMKTVAIASALLVMVGAVEAGPKEDTENLCRITAKLVPVFQDGKKEGTTESEMKQMLMRMFDDPKSPKARLFNKLAFLALSDVYEKPRTTTQSGFYRTCVDEALPLVFAAQIKLGN